MKKPLHQRLLRAFGEKAVGHAIGAMTNPWAGDPTRYLTDEGKQKLFELLRADASFTKRLNAQNRRIAAERKAHAD